MSAGTGRQTGIGSRTRSGLAITLVIAVFAVCELANAAPKVSRATDAEAATQRYLERLSDERLEASARYSEGGYWILLWTLLWQIAINGLLLASGLSVWMRAKAEGLVRFKWLQTTSYALLYIVAVTVLTLPWNLYHGFLRERAYGLAHQDLGEWLIEQGAVFAINLVLLVSLLIPVYSILRRPDRKPWLWGSVATITLFVVVTLAAPVFLLPLFNNYTPLEDETVLREVQALSEGSGLESRVVQFDASRQSPRISAHISGLFGTRQISLSDNLLGTSLPEIRAVVAHEIGHQVLNHIWEKILFFGVVITLTFAAIQRISDSVFGRYGSAWHVRGRHDLAGFPVLAAAFSLLLFLASPVVNTFIRTNEAEADLFSLHAAREPDGLAEAALKLAESSKMAPAPLEEWLFWDHPSPKSRIAMAMDWKLAQRDPESP